MKRHPHKKLNAVKYVLVHLLDIITIIYDCINFIQSYLCASGTKHWCVNESTEVLKFLCHTNKILMYYRTAFSSLLCQTVRNA